MLMAGSDEGCTYKLMNDRVPGLQYEQMEWREVVGEGQVVINWNEQIMTGQWEQR